MGKLKPPRHVLLPGKTEEGRNRFLDLGYILPFGDIVEVMDKVTGGEGANTSFEPLGGPWQAVMEAGFNKSLFTKKPIYLGTDSLTERTTKISDHLGKALFPAWTPPVPFTGFRGGDTTGAFRKGVAPTGPMPCGAPTSASH